jgi:DNA-binding NtrC family response regulator
MKKGSILIVNDNKNVLASLRILLENYFKTVTTLSSPEQIYTLLREVAPDIVLLDMNFSAGINSENEGLFWLSEIKKQDANLSVVLSAAYVNIDLAVKALKRGATDFVIKPWNNAKLVATLKTAYSLRELQNRVKQLREQQIILSKELNRKQAVCWGISEAIRDLRRQIKTVAQTNANILITGESGTGKGVVAGEIHRLSLRAKEILMTIDVGAVTESLFESELFGYMKGAFTNAKADRAGKFEVANHGTLFLDEIGNLSFPMQEKLLNVLQSRQIMRAGGNRPIPINIRLICATNRDLHELVRKGEFREDLLCRINTIQVEIPPLRERKEDIPSLAGFFLDKYARKYDKKEILLSHTAIKRLQEHYWPGNIRELQHVVEKAVILLETNILQIHDFYSGTSTPAHIELSGMTLEEIEKMLILNALKRNHDNVSITAAQLGITRPTLYNKIKKL